MTERPATWYWRIWWWVGYNSGLYRISWWWQECGPFRMRRCWWCSRLGRFGWDAPAYPGCGPYCADKEACKERKRLEDKVLRFRHLFGASEPCECGCPGDQYDGHVCEDYNGLGATGSAGPISWSEETCPHCKGYPGYVVCTCSEAVLAKRAERASRTIGHVLDCDPRLSGGTCTDCKAQPDGAPCWCGDTLGCTC